MRWYFWPNLGLLSFVEMPRFIVFSRVFEVQRLLQQGQKGIFHNMQFSMFWRAFVFFVRRCFVFWGAVLCFLSCKEIQKLYFCGFARFGSFFSQSPFLQVLIFLLLLLRLPPLLVFSSSSSSYSCLLFSSLLFSLLSIFHLSMPPLLSLSSFSFSIFLSSFASCFLVSCCQGSFFPNSFLNLSLLKLMSLSIFVVSFLLSCLCCLFLLSNKSLFCPSWGLQRNCVFTTPC